MPNVNYRAGRNFEYSVKKHYAKRNMLVMRSAGSHGIFDLSAWQDDKPPVGIQCKRTESMAEAKALLNEFRSHPPLKPSKFYRQVMEVKVKGVKEALRVEV